MEIGIDASRLNIERRTGTENYSWQITRGLLDLPSRHHFRLYFNQPPSSQILPELQRAELEIMPFPRLWTHLRLSREMQQHPPDILFVPAHVLPVLHPPHSVVTIHDLGYLYYPEAHTQAARLYLDYSTRFSAATASHIIAVSEATRQDLIRHYRIDPAKIFTIYHGFDQQRFRAASAELIASVRSQYNIGNDPYLLFVGTVQPRKNLVRLLEAFADLVADKDLERAYPDLAHLQLVIGGKLGWLSAPITQRIAELGISTRVKIIGYVADPDLPALLSGAKIFVLPSLYEGFGLPVLEAMACGTPVVCSNAGSLPEIVGEAALLHHPLDIAALTWNLRLLLTSTPLRTRFRNLGLARAQSFSWQSCATQTLIVLESTNC